MSTCIVESKGLVCVLISTEVFTIFEVYDFQISLNSLKIKIKKKIMLDDTFWSVNE